MTTLLKRTDGRWDEATAFMVKNAKHAVMDDGSPRYTGDVVQIQGTVLKVEAILTAQDMQWIMRFVGINALTGNETVKGGMIQEPSGMIRFNLKGRTVLHLASTGETFRAVAA